VSYFNNFLVFSKLSACRHEKLVELALLYLWGEVCGDASPDDGLSVAHKPIRIELFELIVFFQRLFDQILGENVEIICNSEGIQVISQILEFYLRSQNITRDALFVAIGLITVLAHNNSTVYISQPFPLY
jgi:hypothetical protein